MATHIHIYPGRRKTGDEVKHDPKNGQFTSGGGSSGKSTGKAAGPGGAAERAEAKGTKPAPKKPAVNMHSLKEGQALYDGKGQKVDEISSIAKRAMGGWTLHTRAGYEIHVDGKTGANARGWSNEKPAS